MSASEILGWVLLSLPWLYLAVLVAPAGWEVIMKWFETRRRRRISRIEAELDRTQAELRRTIFALSSELSANALEARKALIRESFLARGELPKD